MTDKAERPLAEEYYQSDLEDAKYIAAQKKTAEKYYIDLSPDKCIAIQSRHILLKHKSDGGAYYQGRPINPIESVLTDIIVELRYRAEAAEARADQLGGNWINCIVKLEAAEVAAAESAAFARGLQNELKDAEAKSDEFESHLDLANAHAARLMQERDELRRQLSEAQTAIDAMAQIVGAADEVKHQFEQAQSDIEDYRAEIARLHQAATA